MNYFQPQEFDCRCGSCKTYGSALDATFLARLNELRFFFGKAMIVTSGVRCVAHNKDEGGEAKSYHLVANGACAADIAITGGEERRRFIKLALDLGFSVGVHRNFIHLDDRLRKFGRAAVLFVY